jgi:hypothetical protein
MSRFRYFPYDHTENLDNFVDFWSHFRSITRPQNAFWEGFWKKKCDFKPYSQKVINKAFTTHFWLVLVVKLLIYRPLWFESALHAARNQKLSSKNGLISQEWHFCILEKSSTLLSLS